MDWRKRTQWDFIDLKQEDVGLARRKDVDPTNNWGSSRGGIPFPRGNFEIFEIPKRSKYLVSAFKWVI